MNMLKIENHIKISYLMILIVITQLLVSGCGFQPRGGGFDIISSQDVFLHSNNPYGLLERNIRSKLRIISITLEEQKNYNSIGIIDNKVQQKVISVDANGRPAEYEIVISVKVVFDFNNGQQQQNNISVRRDYRYDSQNSLASDRELEKLNVEMYKNLSDRIIYQYFNQLSVQPNPAQTDKP